MKNKYFDPRISRIIQLELIITEALSKGHKAKDDDEFEEYRKELKQLRKELDIKRQAQ
jgi:hypothetical protein